MRADAIAGYQYDVDTWHGPCLVDALVDARELSPAARHMPVEEVLDQHAGANAIDRSDEHTFDSADFPKVLFVVDAHDDQCARCRQPLL